MEITSALCVVLSITSFIATTSSDAVQNKRTEKKEKTWAFKESLPVSKQKSGEHTKKATLLVNPSESVEISFREDAIRENTLHADLLRMYKKLLDEVLDYGEMKDALSSLSRQVRHLQSQNNRLETIEKDVAALKTKAGNTGSDSPLCTPMDESKKGTDKSSYLDQISGSASAQEIASILRKELKRQNNEIKHLKDVMRTQRRTMNNVTSDLALLRHQVQDLDHMINEQSDQLTNNKAKVSNQASKIEIYSSDVQLTKSRLEALEARVYGIATDKHRPYYEPLRHKGKPNQGGKGGNQVVQPEIEQTLDEYQRRIVKVEERVAQFHQYMSGNNTILIIGNGSINSMRVGDVLDYVTGDISKNIQKLNRTQLMIWDHNMRQQKQMDELSLDVEQLKDDQSDLDHTVEEVQHDAIKNTQDNEKTRRKLETLHDDLKDLVSVFHGVTKVRQTHEHNLVVPITNKATTSVSPNQTPDPHDKLTPGHNDVITEKGDSLIVTSEALLDTLPTANPTPDQAEIELPVTTRPVIATTPPDHAESRMNGQYHDKDEQVGAASRQHLWRNKGKCQVKSFGKAEVVATFPRRLAGTWMKDATATPTDRRIYVLVGTYRMNHLREYADEKALAERNISKVHQLPFHCTGSGSIIYQGDLYCHKYNSDMFVKFNLKTREAKSEVLPGVSGNLTFPYSTGAHTNLDFSVDELGLWVIYAQAAVGDRLVIAKIDPETLKAEHQWVTERAKSTAGNTFMICGKMFATEHRKDAVIVSYIYDTNTSRAVIMETPLFLSKGVVFQSMLEYNPREAYIYSWNSSKSWDGKLVKYKVYYRSVA